MSVVIFAENSDGKFKKGVFEAATYAYKTASKIGTEAHALVIGNVQDEDLSKLGKYGISKVLKIATPANDFHPQPWSELIAQGYKNLGGTVLVVSNTYTGKSIAPSIAVKLNASLATNVVELPDTDNGFSVKRGAFSGKGYAYVSLYRANKVIALTPNSIDVEENEVTTSFVSETIGTQASVTNVIEISKTQGKIPLTEAEIVVSAGRGMKGPENWGMVEELATILGAATACSKPVSDMGWRPHSEHVGQTGITIKPNLNIAIGISGAIQHLAGVSSSKVIVVINTDPEAPFFKIADYGIVGDAFQVLPKLIAAAKATMNS